MKYSIIISTNTGNTRCLAEVIQSELQKISGDKVAIFEKMEEQAKEAEVIFAGFWTDKGSCTMEMKEFLSSLENKRIFLFGTAGFGGEEDYFIQILNRVKTNVQDSNQIIGEFMCQGKMPMTVRSRYEGMLAKNPDDTKLQSMIKNFDLALSHPDACDMSKLRECLQQSLTQSFKK